MIEMDESDLLVNDLGEEPEWRKYFQTYHRSCPADRCLDRIQPRKFRYSPSSRWKTSCWCRGCVVVVAAVRAILRRKNVVQYAVAIIIDSLWITHPRCAVPRIPAIRSDRTACRSFRRTAIRTDPLRAHSWRDRRIRGQVRSTEILPGNRCGCIVSAK